MAMDLATVERWQRAAQRALAADLPHQLRQRGAAVIVPSKSTDSSVYHVQLTGSLVGQCDCPAGLAGKPCAHRAAVAIRLYERQTGVRVAAVNRAGASIIDRYLRAA